MWPRVARGKRGNASRSRARLGGMCGRYAATAGVDELIEAFEVDEVTPDGTEACVPRWNVAPTTTVPAVLERREGGTTRRKLVGLRWGLVPGWAKDGRGGARMINARVETVARLPAFRKPFAARRCLLPALGYYEWLPETDAGRPVKQPYFLQPADGALLAMAGIYEFWRGPDGWLASCSIITTDATDEAGWVHDRMPMTVSDVRAWLDPELTDTGTALGLLRQPLGLAVRRVSTAVNRSDAEGPGLIARVGSDPAPGAGP